MYMYMDFTLDSMHSLQAFWCFVYHQTTDHIEASVEVALARVEKGNCQLDSAVSAKVHFDSLT